MVLALFLLKCLWTAGKSPITTLSLSLPHWQDATAADKCEHRYRAAPFSLALTLLCGQALPGLLLAPEMPLRRWQQVTLTQQGLRLEKEEGNEESEGKGVSSSAPWAPLLPFGTPQPPLQQGNSPTAPMCAPKPRGLPGSPLPLRADVRRLLLTLGGTSGKAGAAVTFLLPRARPFLGLSASSSFSSSFFSSFSSSDFGGFPAALRRCFEARGVTWVGVRAGSYQDEKLHVG